MLAKLDRSVVADPLQLVSQGVVILLRRLTGDHAMIVEQHISLPMDICPAAPEVGAVHIRYCHPTPLCQSWSAGWFAVRTTPLSVRTGCRTGRGLEVGMVPCPSR